MPGFPMDSLRVFSTVLVPTKPEDTLPGKSRAHWLGGRRHGSLAIQRGREWHWGPEKMEKQGSFHGDLLGIYYDLGDLGLHFMWISWGI